MIQNTIDDTVSNSSLDLSLQTEDIFYCDLCFKKLCPREHVINLAMGRTVDMYCLSCLGKRDSVTPQYLLAKIKHYILSRQCFQKAWIKYKDVSVCPDPANCLSHSYDS